MKTAFKTKLELVISKYLTKNIPTKDYSFREPVKFNDLTLDNGVPVYKVGQFTITVKPEECGAACFMFETMTIKIDIVHRPELDITVMVLSYDYIHPEGGHNGYTAALIVKNDNTVVTRDQWLNERGSR